MEIEQGNYGGEKWTKKTRRHYTLVLNISTLTPRSFNYSIPFLTKRVISTLLPSSSSLETKDANQVEKSGEDDACSSTRARPLPVYTCFLGFSRYRSPGRLIVGKGTGARRQRGSVRARRALGPLMFPGGSIVGKRRHDRNVIMSVLKLLSLTDEPSRGTVKKWAKPRSRVSHINRRFTCTRAFYLFFLSLSSLEKDRYLSIDKIII